jgi:hypothetical protein
VVVADKNAFLIARGWRLEELTDYDIEEAFEATWKNEQHDRVEFECAVMRPHVTAKGLKELERWRRRRHEQIEDGA